MVLANLTVLQLTMADSPYPHPQCKVYVPVPPAFVNVVTVRLAPLANTKYPELDVKVLTVRVSFMVTTNAPLTAVSPEPGITPPDHVLVDENNPLAAALIVAMFNYQYPVRPFESL